jgi:hypothetical protein
VQHAGGDFRKKLNSWIEAMMKQTMMKRTMIERTLMLTLSLFLLVPHAGAAQRAGAAERAWAPFFKAFRAAVKRRDRAALRGMMARDFYYHNSGGDENGDEDTRDEALDFWTEPRVSGWEALEKTLARGTAPNTVLREKGNRRPSRVAPPAANSRRAIESHSFEWYVVFEFREGRWYCVTFSECCD